MLFFCNLLPQVSCSPGFDGGLPQQFRLSVYRVDPGGERALAANLSNPKRPDFSVSGLRPGSQYLGEVAGYNVKGVGVPITIRVYTLKPPERLIPSITAESNPREWQQQQDVTIFPQVCCTHCESPTFVIFGIFFRHIFWNKWHQCFL